jgi:hypothetical protein
MYIDTNISEKNIASIFRASARMFLRHFCYLPTGTNGVIT